MKNFATCCTILGGFILSFGLLSLFIKERLYIAETAVATTYGIICKMIISKNTVSEIMSYLNSSAFIFHFSHIVLSLQLVAVGVTVPKAFMKKNWRPLMVLLFPIMIIMYVISAVIIKYCCNVDWLCALIIGACITPTDPILASTISKGKFANKYIPSKLRHLLTIESGANDGLGFPLLSLPIFLLKYQSMSNGVNMALRKWIITTWGFEILLAIVVGIVIGVLARVLLKYSIKKRLIDKENFLVYSLALAVLITGVTAYINSDDLLAVFFSGVAFSWDEEMVDEMKKSHVMEVVDLIFNHAFFILLGITMHVEAFTFGNCLAAVLVLLFRRLPAVLLAKLCGFLPELNIRESLFAGWFGPIGVGAIFFAYHTEHSLEGSNTPEITALIKTVKSIIYVIVFGSIFVHGTTAPIIHLHLRRRNKKSLQTIDLYTSDTEVEREIETPQLPQIR
ncbi:sodium/hydrogen antiporter [Nematocida sp. AWRm80]|nr:sodium/hydrogen antiporter [Nematocida sp. AWRm80]